MQKVQQNICYKRKTILYYAKEYYPTARVGFIITYATPTSTYGGYTAETEAMKEYSAASEDYKKLTNQVEMILAYSMQGEDPDAIDLEATCTGSCATCGGCH